MIGRRVKEKKYLLICFFCYKVQAYKLGASISFSSSNPCVCLPWSSFEQGASSEQLWLDLNINKKERVLWEEVIGKVQYPPNLPQLGDFWQKVQAGARDPLAPGPEKIREWAISPGSGTPPFLCCLPWLAFYWLLGNILAMPVVVAVHMYSTSEDCTQGPRTVHIPVVWVYTCTLPSDGCTQDRGQQLNTAKAIEASCS